MKSLIGSLPLQILAFLVIPLLVLLTLVSFGGVALHQTAMRNQGAEHNIHTVRGAAASLSEHLVHQEDMLLLLVGQVESQDQAQETIVNVDQRLETLFDGGIAIYDADHQLLAASSQATWWESSTVLTAALKDVEVTGEPTFFPIVEPGQNTTSIAIVLPTSPAAVNGTRSDVDANLVLAGVHSLEGFGLSGVLQGLHSETTTAYIVTEDGYVIYHSDPSTVGQVLTDSLYLNAALSGDSGADFRTDSEGRRVITSFAPIQKSGWILVQDEYWTETIGPLMRYSQAAPLALLPGLLVAAGAVWFGIRRVVQPLQQLEGRARDLTWGDFSSIEESVGGIDEIERLQDTLQHLAKRVQTSQAGMRHYIRAITQAQEDERARVARELHDQTIQALIALDHREQLLKRHLTDDPEGGEVLTELRAMTAQTIDDLRRTISAMRPVYLEDLGLVPALKALANDLEASDGFTTAFEMQGKSQRLPPEHEMALYRVTQEAMNNVRYHSQAEKVTLIIRFAEDEVILSVRDDGQGFAAPSHVTELSNKRHFGLVGMYERAALIGAHLQIQSSSGEGTTVIIRAPRQRPGSNHKPASKELSP
jgi:two-component system sensor histidine kinase UhpB